MKKRLLVMLLCAAACLSSCQIQFLQPGGIHDHFVGNLVMDTGAQRGL